LFGISDSEKKVKRKKYENVCKRQKYPSVKIKVGPKWELEIKNMGVYVFSL